MTDLNLHKQTPQDRHIRILAASIFLLTLTCIVLLIFFTIPFIKPLPIPADILEASTVTAQDPANSAFLVFTHHVITSGTAVEHEENSGIITLRKPGFYQVMLFLSGQTDFDHTADNLGLFFMMDGKRLINLTKTISPREPFMISATTVVEVAQGQVSWLALQNDTTGVTFNNVSILVYKMK